MRKFLLTLTAVVALTVASKIMVVGAQETAAAPEAMEAMEVVVNEILNNEIVGNEVINAVSNEVLNAVVEAVEAAAPVAEGMAQ